MYAEHDGFKGVNLKRNVRGRRGRKEGANKFFKRRTGHDLCSLCRQGDPEANPDLDLDVSEEARKRARDGIDAYLIIDQH